MPSPSANGIVKPLAPGLSYWLAPSPDWRDGENWPRDVPSFRFESPDGLVYVDPLSPPVEERPAWILLTAPWHARSMRELVERHPHVRVWAPPDAHWKEPKPLPTDELPAGVEALLPENDRNEALFWLPEQRALITGDALTHTDGDFRVFIDDNKDAATMRWFSKLLGLPVEQVLVAHGPFVLVDARARLREAIEAVQ
jgi:hypothetical protein